MATYPTLALLIGDHGQGKTTTCRRLADQARSLGLSVGGIIQPAVYQAGACIGYEVLDLSSGRSVRLAIVGRGGVERAGRFQFLPEGLAFGKEAISRAARERPRLIIVDEVGPLELAGGGWSEPLGQLRRSGASGQAALSEADTMPGDPSRQAIPAPGEIMLWTVRRSLVTAIRDRWGAAPDSAAERLTIHDLSHGRDAVISDILMSLQR